nr:hypothetical protein [Tanacetum cinerariifolium]GFA00640.1 hypothetical protein [Tanacetum cinerariifolium]
RVQLRLSSNGGFYYSIPSQGEGSGTPTEPHHTPFPEAETSHPTTSSIPLPSIPTALIPPVTQPDPTPIRQYTRRARIAQSSALLTVEDEPASPVRDVSEGEACPTESGFIAYQDRATIAKSSTLPHDSAPRAQEEEIVRLKERVQVLDDREGGINVPTSSGSIPTAGLPATIISTGSEVGPTASPIVTRRKGKEVMVESDTPKMKKLQEQIDAQVARELEKQQEKEDMRMNEQIARDTKVARIHAEEELQGMIDSLDKSNETIAKYLQEYQEFALELPLEKRIELISDLVEDFIPMGSKEETERLKGKGLNLEKEHVKKQKSSEEAPETETSIEEFTKEKMKEMMQLVLVEDVYVQSLQVKHPIIDWKVHTEGQRSYWQIIRLGGNSACYQFFIDLLKQLDREDLNQLWALVKEYLSIRPATCEKEMELWVEHKRMYKPDPEDQLSIKFRGGLLGIKCTRHSHCHVKCSHWQYKFPLPLKVVAIARRLEMPLAEVCTAMEEKKKKLSVKDRWQLH